MAERLKPPKGAKTWDRAIMSILRLTSWRAISSPGLISVMAGRVAFRLAAQMTGLVACVLSYALLAWAMATNAYFSQIVRIQSERGQVVTMHGPYRFVRHPAYAGMIVFELAMSILLASWWARCSPADYVQSCSSSARRSKTAPCRLSCPAMRSMLARCVIAWYRGSGKFYQMNSSDLTEICCIPVRSRDTTIVIIFARSFPARSRGDIQETF